MSAAHTPLPWKMVPRKEGWAIKTKCGCVLAVVFKFPGGAELEPQCEPNAKLITAAPKLAALLQRLIDIEGPQPGDVKWFHDVGAALAEAGL